MSRVAQLKPGYTILEVLVVIAILTILGSLVLPTIAGFRRDTRVKAGADTFRELMADARGQAMEEGQAYRLAVSVDGKRLRVAPDTFESLGEAAQQDDDGPLIREASLPDEVTLSVVDDEDLTAADNAGWRRVATLLPDGTCREDVVDIAFNEPGVNPLYLRVRGLTGSAETIDMPPNAGGLP
jgi:prepilin-type N-terminal cleavage/methylation domain-containing protein